MVHFALSLIVFLALSGINLWLYEIEFKRDLILAMIPISGILLGFIHASLSNILAISSSEIIKLMKTDPAPRGGTRYKELIDKVIHARQMNFISIFFGLFLISLGIPENAVTCWLQIVYISLFVYSLFAFYDSSDLLDKTLGNSKNT